MQKIFFPVGCYVNIASMFSEKYAKIFPWVFGFFIIDMPLIAICLCLKGKDEYEESMYGLGWIIYITVGKKFF